MSRRPLPVLVVLVLAMVATGYAFQANHPWPPGLQSVPDDSPARTPADEMRTFYMPPGYHVELVASEPLIEDPVAIDWDPDGRLWAIEMPGYMTDIQATDEHARTGRIVVLEDTDNDGKMDKRTVFAEGLILPRALKVLDHGVLVGEPPNLWLMRDTNGDLRADTKELVTDTYGRLDASVEHNANTLLWALDNWIYTSEVDTYLRFNPEAVKTGADGRPTPPFEVRKTLARGQWGASQDDAGRVFRNTNESALHVDLVPTQDYLRNPSLLRTRGSYESLEGDRNEVNAVWPVRPTPGVNRGYQNGILRPDGRLANFTSVSSPTVYRGDRLPAELYGNVFVTEPAANLVSRIILGDNGATMTARKAYDSAEFLASTDERFRPVYLSNAPDGTLYLVDLYRGIIQHKGYITEYLRDHIVSHQLEQPIARGRIYRIVHDTTTRDAKPAMAKATPAELVALLSHPNGWRRDTAQRLLVERGATAVAPALVKLATSAPEARTRLQALWTLDGLRSLDVATVTHALADSSRDVRTSGVRLSERWLGDATSPLQAAVVARLDDPDWSVRRQAAASIGELPREKRTPAVAAALTRHGDDPVVVDAALSGVRGDEPAVLAAMLRSATDTPAVTASATMVVATIVRAAQDSAVQQVFTWAADETRPAWQRSILLRGAEVALLSAPMPGAPARGGGANAAAGQPACPTCPGARTGPGGASAFPTAPAAPAAGRGGGRGGPVLRLLTEPALVALAGRGGDLAPRATALVARVEWPGKPGARTPVAPLTPDEARRFAVGKDVFENLCQACHQPDGRGREKVAPSLVGSELALGPAPVAVRILLNGKEGEIGLMPPLGAALSDEQIAGALTYVRREWGQDGSPVDVATVQAVRALTAGRTRPWTNQELAALAKGGGN